MQNMRVNIDFYVLLIILQVYLSSIFLRDNAQIHLGNFVYFFVYILLIYPKINVYLFRYKERQGVSF